MPQCKKDGCKETAIYHRKWGHKRYCETHGHAYADKRDAALKVRSNMPDCASGVSPSCLGKVGEYRASIGKDVCHFCEELADELDRQEKREAIKQWQFKNAETVEELKAWILEYML